MPRGLLALAKAVLEMAGLPPLLVTVAIPESSIYLTNWAKTLTIDGREFVGSGPGGFAMKVMGVSDNLKFEAPSAVLQIDDTSGTYHTLFWADSFRGRRITIAVYYIDTSGNVLATGREETYSIDADTLNYQGVTMRLAAADAVTGTDYPKRTTQRHNCEHRFMGPECGFRFVTGMDESLRTCDHGFNTPNGCTIHFPDVYVAEIDEWFVQAKPFSGPRAGIDHRLVLGGY